MATREILKSMIFFSIISTSVPGCVALIPLAATLPSVVGAHAIMSGESGKEINEESTKQVIIGKTTKQGVRDLFGPPSNENIMPFGMDEQWTWDREKKDYGSVPIVSSSTFEHKQLRITFKGEHVSDCIISERVTTGSVLGASAGDREGLHEKRCGVRSPTDSPAETGAEPPAQAGKPKKK